MNEKREKELREKAIDKKLKSGVKSLEDVDWDKFIKNCEELYSMTSKEFKEWYNKDNSIHNVDMDLWYNRISNI